MKSFFKALLRELAGHGKMLVGYLLLLNPWLTDYPMLLAAMEKFVAEPSQQNLLLAIGQAILALGAGHRLVKILLSVLDRD